MDWDIVYYEEASGRQPGEVFEDSIPKKLAGKLNRFAIAVSKEKFALGGGYFEACHGFPDLFEIRAQVGDDLGRQFCTVDGNRLVLLSGLIKKARNPSPQTAFVEAAAYLADYVLSKKISPEQQNEPEIGDIK